MRHRFLVALYSDIPEEAEIADLLASLPQSRRQEFLRTMVKLGFNALYKEGGEAPASPPQRPKRPVVRKNKVQSPTEAEESSNKTEKDNKAEQSTQTTSHKREVPEKTNVIEDSITTNDEMVTPPTGNESFKENSDESELDPMKKINAMFDGV